MPRKKLRVGVIFGGRSAEHEVSLVSAHSVIKNLDKNKYIVVPIGVDKAGRWMIGINAMSLLKAGKNFNFKNSQVILPEAVIKKVDVIFPLVHGTYGEDGSLQGLLELANLPYIGSGVLGSALGMDKIAQKQICQNVGIPVPLFDYFTEQEFKNYSPMILRRLQKLSLPVFVKPANAGSSIGISKVKQGRDLKKAVLLALKYDRRIIVEKAIANLIEAEVSVLGNSSPQASVVGQIISSNEFYDYDAKYVDGKSRIVIPAPIPSKVSSLIQQLAIKAFNVLDLSGMARIDFLINKTNWKVYLNEVNTIPGFTSISIYPKLWEKSGLVYKNLLDQLISLALSRYSEKSWRNTSYKPKLQWYR